MCDFFPVKFCPYQLFSSTVMISISVVAKMAIMTVLKEAKTPTTATVLPLRGDKYRDTPSIVINVSLAISFPIKSCRIEALLERLAKYPK